MTQPHNFILGLDLDGVTGNYHDAFTQLAAHYLGRPEHELPAPTQWGYADWGLTTDEYLDLHNRAVADGLFTQLQPMPGAVDTLQQLSREGVHIRVITHRILGKGQHYQVVTDTVKWLDDHRVPYWDLCFVRAKQQIDADVFLDDAPHNIANLREAGFPAIVFDAPYNQHVDGLRAHTWDDVYRLVTELRGSNA